MNEQTTQVGDYRYGSFISQSFPVVAMWLHLPLRAVMVIYSASFYVFYASVGLLLLYRFKDLGLAVLFAFYLTLFASATYYWPNNEIHQGVAWLLLALAVNKSVAIRKWPLLMALPLLTASLYLAIWTHPLVMVVAVFLWFFWLIEGANWPYSRLQSVVYSLVLLMLAYLKYNQGMHTGYDSVKIETVTGFHLAQLKNIGSSPQFQYMVSGFATNYWFVPLLFVSGSISMLHARKYLLWAFNVVYMAGFMVLLCITYWDVTNTRFYIESEYMPLTFMCCAPFVYYTLPSLRGNITLALLSVIFLVRLGFIYSAAAPFTNRLVMLSAMNSKMEEKKLTKVVINQVDKAVSDQLIMNWGLAVETVFLSGLKGEPVQRTLLFNADNQYTGFLTSGTDTFIGCWEKRPSSRINQRYFCIDTTVPYTYMSYNDLMK
jgi:hypothetical protein